MQGETGPTIQDIPTGLESKTSQKVTSSKAVPREGNGFGPGSRGSA